MIEKTIEGGAVDQQRVSQMYEHMVLLIGEKSDDGEIGNIEEYLYEKYKVRVEILLFSKLETPREESLYLLYLSDQEIKGLFDQHASALMKIGIIPNTSCSYAINSYGIAKDMFDAIDDVMEAEDASSVDILICNSVPVFGNIIIGNVHGMNQARNVRSNYLKKARAFVSDVRHLSFQNYSITTAKGNVTKTAATGIMFFEHNNSGLSRNIVHENLALNDGRLHALILAPSSVVSYLYYLFLSYFLNRLLIERLPTSVGLIASSKLEITSPKQIEYTLDGERYVEEQLVLEVKRDAVQIYLGRHVADKQTEGVQEEDKDTVRVQGLPKSQMSEILLNEPVPFFPRADEDDFKELFVSLRQSSKLTSIYIMLMILSTLLATTGLFQSSAPVIIGAMILAPLMSPIISFSMGVLRGEKELLQESTTTFLIGIITALLFSCLFTYLMPLNVLTDEMRSRLNPNILDLMVAIISGVAGAYAYAKSEVAKSLAGVAIAVALVPPLSVMGIGIGWWDSAVVYGSFLLFMTNLAGITLSAALTFFFLGFSPIHRAKKGIVFTSIFLIIVSIPLVFSFFKVIEQNKIFTQLKEAEYVSVGGQKVRIQALSVDLSKERPVVYLATISTRVLDDGQILEIKRHVDKILQKEVVVNILSETELH